MKPETKNEEQHESHQISAKLVWGTPCKHYMLTSDPSDEVRHMEHSIFASGSFSITLLVLSPTMTLWYIHWKYNINHFPQLVLWYVKADTCFLLPSSLQVHCDLDYISCTFSLVSLYQTLQQHHYYHVQCPQCSSGFVFQSAKRCDPHTAGLKKIMAWPLGNLHLISLACSYFELAQSSVNSGTCHEKFQSGLPNGQMTAEIYLCNGKSTSPGLLNRTFVEPWYRTYCTYCTY